MQQQSTAKPKPVLVGGAWEAILDKAALEVTNYLASTSKPFDPAGPLSQHMLALLDRSTLLDIVKERNYNRLCGRPGCPELPSGLRRDGAAAGHEIDFSRWRSTAADDEVDKCEEGDGQDSSSCGSSDAGNGNEAEEGSCRRTRHRKASGRARALRELEAMDTVTDRVSAVAGVDVDSADHNHMIKEGNLRLAGAVADGSEEVVYDDDVHIEEAFRLAAREQRVLRRLQRKQAAKQQAQKQRLLPAQAQATRLSEAPAVGGGSGMLGATMEERFCSALCLETFQDELFPLVPRFFEYHHEHLLEAVSSLFPNLRPDTLRQLAGLEAGRTAVVKDVVERPSAKDASASQGDGVRPVAVGLSNESTATRATLQEEDEAGRNVAAQMQRRDVLWDAAVVYRLSRDVFKRAGEAAVAEQQQQRHNAAVAPARSEHRTVEAVGAKEGAEEEEEEGVEGVGGDVATGSHMGAGVRPLSGPLLVLDFLMTISSNTTKRLFHLHYCHHRQTEPQPTVSGPSSHDGSVYDRLVGPVRRTLARKATDSCHGSADMRALLQVEDDLHVDPVLQQQRHELAVSQLFSTDLADALSRLTWVDVSVVVDEAWENVWFLPSAKLLPQQSAQPQPPAVSTQHAHRAYSLVNSLLFPFAVPALLLRPLAGVGAGAPPEVIGIGLVMLLAASLCSSSVRHALEESAEAIEEVLFAVGMSETDVTAALRALVLSEED